MVRAPWYQHLKKKKRKKSENGGKKDFDQTSGGYITQKLVKMTLKPFLTISLVLGGWMLIAI